MRANLDSRVQSLVHLNFELQFEVTEVLVGSEKGVRAAFGGSSEDGPVFHVIVGVALSDAPARQSFAVEERLPAMVPMGIGEERRGSGT